MDLISYLIVILSQILLERRNVQDVLSVISSCVVFDCKRR